MNHPISIHSNDQKQYLSVGIYSVKVLGGWGVKVKDFSIIFKKVGSDLVIKAEETNWRYQSYAFKQRAKRILILDIYESSNYTINFVNAESLKVKPSSLFIHRFLEKEISNKNLKICINC
ncbi:hypothetical protein ACSTS3_05440 [Aquimarina muelleri]|uniref:hypothetical protein n=1 Tax=Aquimarina muelleri TaxID=279356 RepID=UPI003F682B43